MCVSAEATASGPGVWVQVLCINGRHGNEGSVHRWRTCELAEATASGPGIWVTRVAVWVLTGGMATRDGDVC